MLPPAVAINKNKTLKRISRTFFHSTLILTIFLPLTISDKQINNKANSIQKRTDNYEHNEEYIPPQMSSCGSCKMREEIKSRNLEVIKGEVLRKLGFQNAPNMTGKVMPQVPQRFLEMVQQEFDEMQSDQPYKSGFTVHEEEDEYHVKTEKILTFAQPYPRLRHSWRGHNILHFMFSDAITKYHVRNATLFVHIKGADRRPLPDIHLDIFKVSKAPEHSDVPDLHKMYSRKVTQLLEGGIVKVDITMSVSEWFKKPWENFGFVINATVNGKKVAVADMNDPSGNKMSPYVEIATYQPNRRLRRSVALNCEDNSEQAICCRYPLTVDFEQFGWDFIIAPKRYDAHYCSGDCPFVTLQKHAHTHLLKLAQPNSAQPCCAPRKMSAISMLYFDAQLNVVYGSLPGMVVDRCGCT